MPLPTRRKLLFAALALAFGFILYLAWQILLRERTPIEQANRTAIADKLFARSAPTPGSTKAGFTTKASNAARAFAPLPPIDVKLVDIYPRLLAEANEGNARASCRLAYELSRCQWELPMRIQALARTEGKIAKAETPEDRERFEKSKAYSQDRIQVAQDACAGFVDKEGVRPWQYLLNAALAGHAPSMARFAIGPPLNPLNLAQDLEGWAAYRTYAPDFLATAANAGYGPAVITMAIESSGGLLFPEFHPYGVHLAPSDHQLSARYVHAYSHFPVPNASNARFRASMFDKLNAALTPEAMARAKADGEALAATWKPEVFEPKEGRVPGQTLPNGGYDCNE